MNIVSICSQTSSHTLIYSHFPQIYIKPEPCRHKYFIEKISEKTKFFLIANPLSVIKYLQSRNDNNFFFLNNYILIFKSSITFLSKNLTYGRFNFLTYLSSRRLMPKNKKDVWHCRWNSNNTIHCTSAFIITLFFVAFVHLPWHRI